MTDRRLRSDRRRAGDAQFPLVDGNGARISNDRRFGDRRARRAGLALLGALSGLGWSSTVGAVELPGLLELYTRQVPVKNSQLKPGDFSDNRLQLTEKLNLEANYQQDAPVIQFRLRW